MTPYFTEKMRKYFFGCRCFILLAKKVPSLIPTENGQMHPLISKKFIPSLIWNWSVKTQPVSEKIFEKEQKNLPAGSGEQGILAFLLFEYQRKNF